MTLNDKSDAIKYLKSLVVKYQKYEFAAWLRDKEKEILSQLNLPMNSDLEPNYNYFESISYSQYSHLVELISDYEKSHNYNETEIKDYLYKKCINVIREAKLDKLFGDES
jgi:predicted patatin/cPLA2 family phospholipase